MPQDGSRCLLLVVPLLVSACGGVVAETPPESATSRPCPHGASPFISDTLYFGTKKQNRDKSWTTVVSPDTWNSFVTLEIARAFPDGYTAWSANGTWRAGDGTTVTETAYVVTLLHSDTRESEAAIRSVVDTYRSRYEQKSVLRATTFVCARF